MKLNTDRIITILIYMVFVLLFLATSQFPFFFDTVQLASKHAHYFYDTNFSSIILPGDMDSGHIPTLGLYLAAIWKLFGKTLFLSHLAMLPFVIGIIYQSIKIIKLLFPGRWANYALILLLADATLLAQITLVSPDVLLMFFFLMSVNHFFSGNRLWYSVALTGLVLASSRGMMCVAGLLIAEVIIQVIRQKTSFETLKVNHNYFSRISKMNLGVIRTFFPSYGFKGLAYISPFIVASAFQTWHYINTGWIGYNEKMPWAPSFEIVDFNGFIKNIFIFSWRLIDFGRLFLWGLGVYCLLHFIKTHPKLNSTIKELFVILICIFISLSHAVLLHKNLSNHRYFLPIYASFALLVCYYFFTYVQNDRIRRFAFFVVLTGMLSGNFWVYPDHIAKGWDCTLAYLPYFSQREKMMNYMESNNISLQETGTLFPNHGAMENIELSGREESFAMLNLKTNNFVFYSNVYNDISDCDLSTLRNEWYLVKEYRFLQVKIALYKKPQ